MYFLDLYRMTERFSTEELLTGFRTGRLNPSTVMLEEYLAGGFFELFLGLGSESSYRIIGTYPHVVVVQVLTEQGVIGAVLFFGIFSIAFVSLFLGVFT